MNENFKNIVISIPASETIDLIYKYQIHAHPDKVGYCLLYTSKTCQKA